MIIQSYARKVSNTNDIAFTVDKTDVAKTVSALNLLKEEIGATGQIEVDENIYQKFQ